MSVVIEQLSLKNIKKMDQLGPKKHRFAGLLVKREEIFFSPLKDLDYLKKRFNRLEICFQLQGGARESKFISISRFPYKTGFKEGVWFMSCYAFLKSECFFQRHFIFTPAKRQNNLESLRLKILKRGYKTSKIKSRKT